MCNILRYFTLTDIARFQETYKTENKYILTYRSAVRQSLWEKMFVAQHISIVARQK